jgi:hypothetical protein
MNAIAELDRTEALLWTILNTFESLAARQYVVSAPALATREKAEVVALLGSRVHSDAELSATRLAGPVGVVVACATSASERHVLIVQGLFLELIGGAIYRTFGENAATSGLTRDLCVAGLAASTGAAQLIPDLLRTRIGSGDVLLQAIMDESAPLLRSLDALGEGIDEYFSERFAIGFADLMGDVAAELVALCPVLEIDRRKLVAYLTGALMGVA